jgi:predicted neutral ceramidase superfamily lipid hydrolase
MDFYKKIGKNILLSVLVLLLIFVIPVEKYLMIEGTKESYIGAIIFVYFLLGFNVLVLLLGCIIILLRWFKGRTASNFPGIFTALSLLCVLLVYGYNIFSSNRPAGIVYVLGILSLMLFILIVSFIYEDRHEVLKTDNQVDN